MSKSGSKPCDVCGQQVKIRYRIQFDESETWVLVCPQCQKQLSHDNSCYRYGGTWKSRAS